MATYTCKFCGYQTPVLTNMTNTPTCGKSPSGKHEPMNATEKLPEYICKYCGIKSSVPVSIVNSSCSKSPHGKHELLG